MENVSVPNTGPLNDKNATVLARVELGQGDQGRVAAAAAEDRVDRVRESVFRDLAADDAHDILFANDGLDEPAYAREVLRRFATRAYRGPLAPAELDRLVNYWTKARANTDSLEASLRETLGVVLSSPRFLGLPASRTGGAKERLTDHELASRLSYFLWSTMPDETLLRLADEGKLREPAVLSAQVRRMIQDRQGLAVHRAVRRAVAGTRSPAARDRAQGQLPRLRRSARGGHAAGDDPLLRRGAARRPEHLPVPRLRLHVRQRHAWRRITASRASRARSSARCSSTRASTAAAS